MNDIVTKAWELPLMINGFSLIILSVFYLDNRRKHHEFKTQKYLFFQYMVGANIMLLVLDSAAWLINGNPDPLMRIANYVVSTLFYVFDPLPSYFFICFADAVLTLSRKRERA